MPHSKPSFISLVSSFICFNLYFSENRARAAAVNMIPTSTGAAKAMSLVLPSLKGKLDGTAIRVPTPNVSLIDLTLVTEKDVTPEIINDAMIKAAEGELKGILDVNQKPLVSKDFNHNPHSSIFDITQTQVVKGKFSRVLSWYDNEWGFSNRMCDTCLLYTSPSPRDRQKSRMP